MYKFTILAEWLFCSTAKDSLLNSVLTLYPEIFILCKKTIYNVLSLEVYNT